MRRGTSAWRRLAWLACFAVGLNALAPSLSQAAAWLQGRPLGIAIGADRPLGGSASGEHGHHEHHARRAGHHGSDAGAHGDHCPFCFTHAGSFALPPVPPLAWLASAEREGIQAAPVRASAPIAKPRSPAQPRAPPASAG
jgi:hypothetical protein